MATIKKSEVERLRKIEADSVPKNAFANAAQYGINQEKLAKQYDSEAGMWCRHTIRFMNQAEDLKNKLWAAEQEIHDLKEYAEKCDRLRNEAEKDLEFAQNLADDTIERNIDLQTELAREQDENDRATDEWEELVAEQDKDIQDLSNWVIDLLQKPTVIDPPACLKPYDALNWATTYVQGKI